MGLGAAPVGAKSLCLRSGLTATSPGEPERAAQKVKFDANDATNLERYGEALEKHREALPFPSAIERQERRDLGRRLLTGGALMLFTFGLGVIP